MQTAWELVNRAAQRHPHATAIVDDLAPRRLSYAELKSEVEAIAAGLSHRRVGCGSIFATVLPSSFEHSLALLALARLGAISALVTPRLHVEEVAALVGSGDFTGAAVSDDGRLVGAVRAALGPDAPLIAVSSAPSDTTPFAEIRGDAADCPAAPSIAPEATAFVFYTSGTTGLPKGVQVPHRAVESRVVFVATQGGLSYGAHNRALILFPLHHVMGFFAGLLATLALGGTLFVSTTFDAGETLDTIERERITYLAGTPTHYHALLNHPRFRAASLASVELFVYAGASMPQATHEALVSAAAGRVVNMYGTTETMNSLFMRDPEPGSSRLMPGFYANVRAGKIGRSVHEQAATGEEGELLVDATSPSVFTGYLDRPEVTAAKLQDGWYRTGDIVVQLPDDSFDLRGRLDDVIVSGGENIHPEEVERVLLEHPAVAEAAVVGIADEAWGERLVACVVPDGATPSAAELDSFCRESSLARFKRPKDYVFVDRLPKNAANKLLRHLARDTARDFLTGNNREG